jgi:cytidylate kinase
MHPCIYNLTSMLNIQKLGRPFELDDGHNRFNHLVLAEQVRARDERDMNRAESPLVAADDAIELDSSHMSIDEVVEAVMAIIEFKRAT